MPRGVSLCAVFVCLLVGQAQAVDARTALDDGFQCLYALRFREADEHFKKWKTLHPDDPRGPVAQAAGDLFAEFHRLGVLESEFFQDDETFASRLTLKPDVALRARFSARLTEAEELAKRRLNRDSRDPDALFATALVHGLRADYSALILKKNMASLRSTRVAAESARKLLSISPDYYDAYLATGISNYIVGSLFPPVRWILRLGGYSGDKEKGLRDLRLVAAHGRLLAPFARLLLAVAHLREGEADQARVLLAGLRDEFPSNPLYAKEIARIDASSAKTP